MVYNMLMRIVGNSSKTRIFNYPLFGGGGGGLYKGNA